MTNNTSKKEKYQEMFDALINIGFALAKDYPGKQKLFEALDRVANFVGDVAKGRNLNDK